MKSLTTKTLILLCLLLSLASCSRSKTPTLPYLPEDAVVLAFGDSLTHGTGATGTQAYPAQLARYIQRSVVVEATPGDKTSDGLAKLPDALERHSPALVILCLGGNDFLRRVDTQTTLNNMRRMLDMIRASGAAVMLIGVPEPTLLGLRGAAFYVGLAGEYNAPLENEIVARLLANSATRSDRIHPNAVGYSQMALAIAELLQGAGAIATINQP